MKTRELVVTGLLLSHLCNSAFGTEDKCLEIRKTSMIVASLRYDLGSSKDATEKMANENIPDSNPSKLYLQSIIEDAYAYEFGKISAYTYGYYRYVACKNESETRNTKPLLEIQEDLSRCGANQSKPEIEQCISKVSMVSQ